MRAYTGSAAWLHRAALENLIGLKLRPGQLSLSPCLPAHWPFVELTLAVQNRVIHLRWQRAGVADDAAFRPDRELAEGEVLLPPQLPSTSHVLVRGSAPQTVRPDQQQLDQIPAFDPTLIAIK